MKLIWERIEAWLSHNAEPVLASLRTGATEEEITSAESTLGLIFPRDYRESLAIHDGQHLDQFGCSLGFLYGLNLYSLRSVLAGRRMIEELLESERTEDLEIETDGPVRPVWLDQSWVMIADDGNGNYCCLDLIPAEGGEVGQIIRLWGQEHLRRVLVASFREWLTRFADALESGEYVYSESHRGLIALRDAIADGVVGA